MPSHRISCCRHLFLVVALVAGAAFAQAEKAPRLYEDALTRFERNDFGGAIVQLKNALRIDPRMVAGYLLLGRAELARGDPAAAEDAFSRALELGISRSEVAVPMAEALLKQGKYATLLERQGADGLPMQERAELLVLRGEAHRALGDPKSAARAFEDARSADPSNIGAMAAQAELLLQTGRPADAARVAEEAVSRAPGDARAWNLRGRVAANAGDLKTGLAAFDKAVSIDPKYVEPRLARVALLLDFGRLDDAAPDIAYLAREAPTEPRALYLRAVYANQRGDAAAARSALTDLTRAVDPIPRDVLQRRAPQLLILGGQAHYGLGNVEKAREYLESALKADPANPTARQLLGSILLTQGDANGAISMMEPALKASPNDPNVLALLASAHMARRQFDTASAYLERALKASGNAPSVEATLGLSLLGQGQRDLALEHLERAFKGDPKNARAGFALAMLQLRRGNVGRAVEVAEVVARNDPSNPQTHNLLGAARSAAGDVKGARAAYEQAAQLDRSFLPAQLNLARIEAAEGNVAGARARLEGVLRNSPQSTSAMTELAGIEARAGRTEQAIRWLEKVRALNRRDTTAASQLVDLHISRGEAPKALEVAKDASSASPRSIEALEALSRAYLAIGNEKQAQTTLVQMGRLASYDAPALSNIARLQIRANDLRGASFTLDKALTARPDYVPAQTLSAEVDLLSGDLQKAEQRTKQIMARSPNDPEVRRLFGDIAMARKDFPEAVTQYRAAMAREPSTDNVIRIYRALMISGNARQATDVLEAWRKDHPDDTVALRALAEGHLRAGNLSKARDAYEQLLTLQGDDAAVLNNLANILARQKDPRALEYAERAYRLAPGSAAAQDTLGWLLVERGQMDAGLRHLREARLRDPGNPEIRYHLAAALARSGRVEEARRELQPALANAAAFEGKEEARALAKQLGAP